MTATVFSPPLASVCCGETIFCQHLRLGKSAIIILGTSPARLNLSLPSGRGAAVGRGGGAPPLPPSADVQESCGVFRLGGGEIGFKEEKHNSKVWRGAFQHEGALDSLSLKTP